MTFRNLTLVYWHGWNFLALALLLVAAATGVAAWFGVSLILGETLVTQMLAFIIVGLTMACGDLVYRFKRPEFGRTWRFFSPFAGGSVVFMPSWCLGVGVIATAALCMAGIAK